MARAIGEVVQRRANMPITLLDRAPNRVWEQGPNGLWSSRPWRKGEMEDYIRNVLRPEDQRRALARQRRGRWE